MLFRIMLQSTSRESVSARISPKSTGQAESKGAAALRAALGEVRRFANSASFQKSDSDFEVFRPISKALIPSYRPDRALTHARITDVKKGFPNENILCTRDRYDAGFPSDARSCQYHSSNPAVSPVL